MITDSSTSEQVNLSKYHLLLYFYDCSTLRIFPPDAFKSMKQFCQKEPSLMRQKDTIFFSDPFVTLTGSRFFANQFGLRVKIWTTITIIIYY